MVLRCEYTATEDFCSFCFSPCCEKLFNINFSRYVKCSIILKVYICQKIRAIKNLEQNRERIKIISDSNVSENEEFRRFLQKIDSDYLDQIVIKLNGKISSEIDCTKCGACCNKLMINIEESDVTRIAQHLNITEGDFKEKYVESGDTMMIMNTIPCSFLKNKMCTVYEGRFSDCRQFPNLHTSGFKKRLFATLMNYEICPIIFNVIEHLKIITAFKTKDLKTEI